MLARWLRTYRPELEGYPASASAKNVDDIHTTQIHSSTRMAMTIQNVRLVPVTLRRRSATEGRTPARLRRRRRRWWRRWRWRRWRWRWRRWRTGCPVVGCDDVAAAAALGVGVQSQVDGRFHETLLDLRWRAAGMRLKQQRCRAGCVRCSHAGARGRRVASVHRRAHGSALRARGDDLMAGEANIRLDTTIAGWSAGGETGHVVVVIGRADGDDVVCAAG